MIAIDMSLIAPKKEEEAPTPVPFEAYDEVLNKEEGRSHQEVVDTKPPQKSEPLPKPQKQEVSQKEEVVTPNEPKQEPPKIEQTTFPSLQEISAALQKQETTQKQQQEFDRNERELRELYGSEYESLSNEQKKFLTTNIKTIQSVTQRHLNMMGYPEIAIRTRQNGVNLIEFNLYPNGDMSDLKLVEHSGYRALDAHTIELIQRAYKDYPYPNQKTLVRIKVIYNAF